jgi:hypothetical protein
MVRPCVRRWSQHRVRLHSSTARAKPARIRIEAASDQAGSTRDQMISVAAQGRRRDETLGCASAFTSSFASPLLQQRIASESGRACASIEVRAKRSVAAHQSMVGQFEQPNHRACHGLSIARVCRSSAHSVTPECVHVGVKFDRPSFLPSFVRLPSANDDAARALTPTPSGSPIHRTHNTATTTTTDDTNDPRRRPL